MQTRTSLPIEMVKSFSSKELRRFAVFIESRYFNADKDLKVLLEKIIYYCLKTEKFTPEIALKVYNALFKEKQVELNKNQQSLLNKKLNKLLRLSELFLMNETLQEKEHLKNELLIPQLIKRKQNLLFNRILKKETKELDEEKKQGIEYHKRQLKLQEGLQKYNYIKNLEETKDNFDKLQYHFDVSFILSKLSYHLSKLSILDRYPSRKFDFSSFNALEKFFILPQYKEIPLIKIYLLSIRLALKKDIETYNLLTDLLIKNNNTIPKKFLKPFYTILSNYCAKQMRKGNLEFYKHALNVYKEMHKNDLLIKDNAIREGLLKNIVTLSCYSKDFNWAKKILKKYINYVDINIRESVRYFNEGIISFNQQNYSTALIQFNKVENINDVYNIGVKIYRIKCFHEVDKYFDPATEQMTETIRIFLNRTNKLSDYIVESISNFILIFKRIYKLKYIQDKAEKKITIKKDILNIKRSLANFNLISDKIWLYEKIVELENFTT